MRQLKKKYDKADSRNSEQLPMPIIERIQDHNEEVMDKKYGSTSDEGIYQARVARFEKGEKDFELLP